MDFDGNVEIVPERGRPYDLMIYTKIYLFLYLFSFFALIYLQCHSEKYVRQNIRTILYFIVHDFALRIFSVRVFKSVFCFTD